MSDTTTLHQHPYIPNTDRDRVEMLRAIGVPRFEELVRDIPGQHRFPKLDLPESEPELVVASKMAAIARQNVTPGDYACFLGAGAYRHYIPAVCKALASRGEFMTAYTPYQPEAAQGSLQVAFEFQTMWCLLSGMEVANAGMYDGPTAFAEAALMACRLTQRQIVAVLDTVDERSVEVIRSYSSHKGVKIKVVDSARPVVPEDAACLMVQSPNVYGVIEDLAACSRTAHAAGALSVAHVNPTSLGMFRTPGESDVDICTAEGQPLGVPLSYGGSYAGLFACKQAHIRQMPGRIVGRTTDTKGREGYVLTLQTREQHIRRERATSNICTSTQLIGLMVTLYVAALGKAGVRRVAELCYQKAHYAASEIARLPGYLLPVKGTFFHEFVVKCPKPVAEVNRELLRRGIIGGYDLSRRIPSGMLLCVTETNTRQEIDALIVALREIGGTR
jgi:glycine dehydrogenase subunit 1